jgi:putative ABC transport system permease protein
MNHLLKLITLRHITSEKTRTLLTLTGIALGVALFISVRLANESILYAFRETIDAVTGKTTLQITQGDLGLDESLLAAVRDQPGVAAVTPVLQTVAAVEEGRHQATPGAAAGCGGIGGCEAPHGPPQMIDEPLLIMGVDPFSEVPFRDYSFSMDGSDEKDPLEFLLDPQTLFLSESFAQAHGYSTGSTIRLLVDDQAHEFTVRGILKSKGAARAMHGNFAMMDIATYQWRFGRVGHLDRIDLMTQEGIDIEELIHQLSAQLPQGIAVGRPQQRGAEVERMLTAFQLNLTALSAITLLVALFLMYNTMTMAVVRRRTEIGVLRCLGVSAHHILGLFMAEAFALGLIGSLVGVPVGWFLAQWTLKAMGQTVTALYTPVIVRNVVLGPSILVEGLALGCVVALGAGMASVLEAVRVVPREVLHRGSDETSRRLSHGKTSFIGILLLLASLFFSRLPPVDLIPIFGYASALFLLLGFACLVPLTTVLFHGLIHRLPLSWTSTELKLASHSLVSALRRSSMAVTAILTGLAMMGGMMIMIHSFRETVEAWIDQTVSADLFVIPAARSVSGLDARMPEKVLEELRTIPGIQAIDPVQTLKITMNKEQVMLSARDLDVLKNHSRLLMINGNTQEIVKQALGKGEVLVSEPLALRRGIKPGDRLNLVSPTGPVNMIVAGVFYDYTTDGGRILMDNRLFRRHWQENEITTLALYLQPEVSPETIRQDILKQLGKTHRLFIISNRELRAQILDIFDQTFAIT